MARILVIDDNDSFRSLLETMLTVMGHEVTTAGDGLEGANKYRAHPTDLILTDIMMPHSGLATIRVLKEQYPGLQVIAMSGGGAHRLDYAKSVGAHSTLNKPFSPDALAAAIAEALTSNSGQSPVEPKA